MSHHAQLKDESRGFVSWMLWIIGGAVTVYFLGFALLVLFPGARQATSAIGLSPEATETIYYPIIKLLDR
jgi:hypothetical protein